MNRNVQIRSSSERKGKDSRYLDAHVHRICSLNSFVSLHRRSFTRSSSFVFFPLSICSLTCLVSEKLELFFGSEGQLKVHEIPADKRHGTNSNSRRRLFWTSWLGVVLKNSIAPKCTREPSANCSLNVGFWSWCRQRLLPIHHQRLHPQHCQEPHDRWEHRFRLCRPAPP